jgi:type IV pilus assembly protein PilA
MKQRFSSGFTLIEMLVAVAIMVLLAGLAVPNYRKFSARSRQQEARGSLSAVYTAERTFYTEQSTFSACLRYIGYNPVELSRSYAVGFPAYTGSANLCGTSGTQSCLAYAFDYSGVADPSSICSSPGDTAFAETIRANPQAALISVPTAGTAPTKFTFTASAMGNVSPDLKTDQWTINESKIMINTVNGI